MVPVVALPPVTPLTCQVTAVLLVFWTVAVNSSWLPTVTLGDCGEMLTATACCGVVGCLIKPPQPTKTEAKANAAKSGARLAIRRPLFLMVLSSVALAFPRHRGSALPRSACAKSQAFNQLTAKTKPIVGRNARTMEFDMQKRQRRDRLCRLRPNHSIASALIERMVELWSTVSQFLCGCGGLVVSISLLVICWLHSFTVAFFKSSF
jgi:hypothetical protein